MAHSVADLEALRQHWGHDRWVVVGHSFGADLVMAYAAAHPEHTAAVGHLSGRGIGDWRGPDAITRAARLGDRAARLAELTGLETRTWDEEVEWRQLCWAPDYADLQVGLQHSLAQAATDLPINFEANRALRYSEADLIAAARATQCPVHVIHGSADPRPVSTAMALADEAPQGRKRIVQGAGHSPWVERPHETAQLIYEVATTAE